MTVTHSGFVAIVGRPNVGKSTLLNHLLGEKISITTPKPQTTRWQILGIKIVDHAQLIYIDTPGFLREEKNAVNRYMNRVANSVIFDADVLVFLVDATRWYPEDDFVLERLKKTDKPIILAINKIDLLTDKASLLPLINHLKEKYPFVDIVPISALLDQNTKDLEQTIMRLLPEGPQLFPDDQITDKSIRFQIAEIIREKIIQATAQEVPYTTAVVIEEMKQTEKLVDINAIIWVERPGQKIIIIGKGGAKLKKIGTQARRDIEKLLAEKVFLRLWVKVKSRWTDDEKALKTLGYEG